jgi:hypothetical protein
MWSWLLERGLTGSGVYVERYRLRLPGAGMRQGVMKRVGG